VVECSGAEGLVHPARKCTLTARDAFDRRQPRSTAASRFQLLPLGIVQILTCKLRDENVKRRELKVCFLLIRAVQLYTPNTAARPRLKTRDPTRDSKAGLRICQEWYSRLQD
jgi:hypothetical protein